MELTWREKCAAELKSAAAQCDHPANDYGRNVAAEKRRKLSKEQVQRVISIRRAGCVPIDASGPMRPDPTYLTITMLVPGVGPVTTTYDRCNAPDTEAMMENAKLLYPIISITASETLPAPTATV